MIANPVPWPNGARCACAITFDMDADSLIHIARPKDSHRRLYPTSMGRYGPTVAVPRILETYRKFGLKQSFFIPGWCIEKYPETVEAILNGGHEVGHHGYLHENPVNLTTQEHRHWFERALDAHDKVCGQRPRGYRAPVYDITPDVVDLLIEHGFLYESSMMADEVPYLLQHEKGTLWEVPVHWGTDDWPPFAHYEEIGYMMPVRAPSLGLQAFWEEFEAHYEHGGLFMLILHPFLTGRLARWRLVEAWIEQTLDSKDVWFAPLEEIVRHVERMRDEGLYTPRIEKLPYYDAPVAGRAD
ncbi:MAG: polysaccharide deacetylase [Pseudomonadota bacterium]